MSYKIQVFCEQSQEVSFHELNEFILEGAYFEDAKVDILTDENGFEQSNHRVLKVNYEDNKPPIIIYNVSEAEGIAEETKELLFVLDLSKKSPTQKSITEKILKTSQVFVIDFEKELISDDCWEMLDSIEGFLAHKYDGVVYAPDDGFFSKDLDHLYSL
jgi:hypothetical protein